jgi:hypothetical protein
MNHDREGWWMIVKSALLGVDGMKRNIIFAENDKVKIPDRYGKFVRFYRDELDRLVKLNDKDLIKKLWLIKSTFPGAKMVTRITNDSPGTG